MGCDDYEDTTAPTRFFYGLSPYEDIIGIQKREAESRVGQMGNYDKEAANIVDNMMPSRHYGSVGQPRAVQENKVGSSVGGSVGDRLKQLHDMALKILGESGTTDGTGAPGPIDIAVAELIKAHEDFLDNIYYAMALKKITDYRNDLGRFTNETNQKIRDSSERIKHVTKNKDIRRKKFNDLLSQQKTKAPDPFSDDEEDEPLDGVRR